MLPHWRIAPGRRRAGVRPTAVRRRLVCGFNRLHRHALRGRVGGTGEGHAPGLVGVVADAAPVYSAKHDGGRRSEQDDADGPQWVVHGADRLDPAAAQRMAWRRGDVGMEGGEVEGRHGGLDAASG